MASPAAQKIAKITDDSFELSARDFETNILGLSTWSLTLGAVQDLDYPDVIARALRAAKDNDARLLSCRCPESNRVAIAALEAAGFQVIEQLVTLAADLPTKGAALPQRVRLSTRADADGVEAIASAVFQHDRFHRDPKVPNASADRLKGAWARNSVNGRADAVFVIEDEGHLAGFNACLVRGDTAVIDLIGVAEGHQGRGLGRDLVAASLAHYAGKATRMLVGTQSANHASLALYEAAGFRAQSSAITLHVHLD